MTDEPVLIDRELSWLSFNGRVLQEAGDPRVPLYERIKFLAIFSSNLDEYFRVRVAGLRSLLSLGKKKRKKMGLDPVSLLRSIYLAVDVQQQQFGAHFSGMLPALAAAGTPLLAVDGLSEEQGRWLSEYAEREVLPFLDPVILGEKEQDGFLRNRALYFIVRLRIGGGRTRLARVSIPSDQLPRFVPLPSEGDETPLVFLDDVVRTLLPRVFPDVKSIDAWSVKLNRDADLHIEDEFSGDLVKKIREAIKLRDTGVPSRFLYDETMPRGVIRELRQLCKLAKEDLFPGGRYHNFHDLFSFPRREGEHLTDVPQPPLPCVPFDTAPSMFYATTVRDLLLHFPYQRFDYVAQWLEEAAKDEAVTEICITLYRIASNSRIAGALLDAVQCGKRVFVFMEIKARFDEDVNLQWSDRLKAAGAVVAYSIPGLKVHAKLFLITRLEDREERRYAYLGTGNFNEKTATLYGDHGLFTAASDLTSDVAQVFALLKGETPTPRFSTVLVARFNLRSGINAMIEREIALAKSGKPASIIMKMNSLEDPKIARRLAEAARAGVRVQLIVRGISVLAPASAEESDNLSVVSIIDRYLEHARVFIFGNDGSEEIWLASADMMRRNLNRRIEVAFPVRDERLKTQMRRIIDLQLADCVKSRRITTTRENEYIECDGRPSVRAQIEIYRFLQAAGAGVGA